MPTPTAGTVQQYLSPAVIPPPTFRQFVQRRLRGWVLYCGYVWSILLPYNSPFVLPWSIYLGPRTTVEAEVTSRHRPLARKRRRAHSRQPSRLSYRVLCLFVQDCSLALCQTNLLIDPATAKHSERVASFAILYVPGTVLAVVASVAISAEIMHVWFKYVDPVSLIGVYCFGSVIMVPTSLLLGVIGLRLHSMWKGRQR
ncbi:hypothetical protein DL96DRAFT_504884 [Flagelloscypha sp. PMI_526]|nr:hypothetical protein DL96DRAFT_504884 [Flagelloscypha sp. PMI_526]